MKSPSDELQKLRDKITEERPYVDVRPYSHNIVTLTLQRIAKQFGKEAANQAIRDLKLKALGWDEVP